MSGVRGTVVAWGVVARKNRNGAFDVTIGGRPLCGLLLPFDCARVYILRAFAAVPFAPRHLPDLAAAVLEGSVHAAAGYQEADWSEVTPGSYWDEMCQVGGHDLREEFLHRLGQHCVLVASTAPIDVTALAEDEDGG